MATYQITVASGNLYGGGTGNVYYVNGVRNTSGPGNFNWNTDTVLRFDQSDSSNNNHPLLFSTNTTTGGIISSGVTYYLDGSSNQSDYMDSSTFNAASERYVEIDLTDTTANFYYLCWYHGIGMGGVMQKNSDKTYTTTVASGTLYVSGGTGNVFYLDGVRDMDLKWVEGGTLRFNQDDNTNDGHPLLFSANTSPVSPISSGVNYWLDGPSDESDYSNLSKFNAATERYVEIAPASSSDFHYYCYIHGIGMGGAIDVTQDTWGALGWNINTWGEQDEVKFSLTGLSATATVGNLIPFPEQGWGADRWGDEGWGGAESLIPMPAFTLNATVNLPEDNVAVTPGWGTETWGQNGWGDVQAAKEPLPAQSLTSTLGSIGDIPQQKVGLTGLSLTSTLNSPSIVVDCTLTLPSQSLTSNLGGVGGVIVEILPSQSLTSTVGSPQVSSNLSLSLSAPSLSATLGSPDITSNPGVQPIGVSATSTLGSLDFVFGEPIQGLSATSSLGSLTVTTFVPATMPAQSLTSTLNGSKINLFYINELTPNTSANYTAKNYNTSATYTDKKYQNQP